MPLRLHLELFQGIYRFPLERYLDRLLPSVLPRKFAAGAK
jgi:hypothetical protein